jgi:hypothetical protein
VIEGLVRDSATPSFAQSQFYIHDELGEQVLDQLESLAKLFQRL